MAAQFFWYELTTGDLDAALGFYQNVVGWKAVEFVGAGPRYVVLNVGERGVGGALALTTDRVAGGAPVGWLGYVDSLDVDADAAQIKAAGGAIHRPPSDIPGVGRFAVVADPQGAAFVIMNPIPPAQPLAALEAGTPGTVGWRELHAADGTAAFDFYGAIFGWTKAEAFDMGPMGTYQLFSAGAQPVGGLMTKGADSPGPFWLYYFNVEDIAAAAQRVRVHGGLVLSGPQEVPGGNRVLRASDPQGGMFALSAPGGSRE